MSSRKSVGLPGAARPSCAGAGPAVRQQVNLLRLGHRQPQQLLVALPGLFAAIDANFLQVDLKLQLQIPLGGARPHGAGRGGHRFQEALEQFSVKGGRGDVRFAQPGDFFQALTQAPAFAFDHFAIRIRTASS